MQHQAATTGRLYDQVQVDQRQREAINQSNRLLSGSAYRGGLRTGLDLLNRLRSDPYKAKSPEANSTLRSSQLTPARLSSTHSFLAS